jgi:hypothetical protein
MNKYKLPQRLVSAVSLVFETLDTAIEQNPDDEKVIGIAKDIRNTLQLELLMFEMSGDYSKLKNVKNALETHKKLLDDALAFLNNPNNSDSNTPTEDENERK